MPDLTTSSFTTTRPLETFQGRDLRALVAILLGVALGGFVALTVNQPAGLC